MAKFQLVSADELVAVLRTVDSYGPAERRPMWTALFCVLSNLGLRISEALLIEWRHVDFHRSEIVVQTLKRRKKQYDILPMNGRVRQALEALRNAQASTERVFPVSRRVAYNVFNALLHRAGIPPRRLHALRHTCATWLLEATGDIKLVQDMMRHANLNSTMVYVHTVNLRKKYLAVPPLV